MEFNEYQQCASTTAEWHGRNDEYKKMYLCMGLAGETGELIEKMKKVIRNDGGVVSDEMRTLIKLEVGDVLWYLSQVAKELNITLDEAATANIAKLSDRAKRGVIASVGDTR